MKAKAVYKQIGKVGIIELMGQFKGAAASRCNVEIERSIANGKQESFFFITRSLEDFDDHTIQPIIRFGEKAHKCAVLTRNPFIAEKLIALDKKHRIAIFEDHRDAVRYFQDDLTDAQTPEKREFTRLKVALPAEGSFERSDGGRHRFFSIVTNLSVKGMFASFLDQQSELILRKNIDIYDLTMIDFSIELDTKTLIDVRGKLIHIDAFAKGIGIEFYEFAPRSKELLEKFLERSIKTLKD